MNFDAALVDELRRVHAIHTVILYGSYVRGDATSESDIDVAGFADTSEILRDARIWNGRYLDGFVYPTSKLVDPPVEEMLKFRFARVLCDERDLAKPFLAAVGALDRRGPAPLSEPEARMRRVWAKKMLGRIRRDDIEGRYRRHWLLYQLLEDHFALRGAWYRGPKDALATLRDEAPSTFTAFERALDPAAPPEALEALVEHVGRPQ